VFNIATSPLRFPICSICQRPLGLDNARADERGDAIHEDCYLIKLGVAKPPTNLTVSSVYVLKAFPRKQCLGR
jgi:hypothetical protein